MKVINSDFEVLNDLSYQIIGPAFKVHRQLDPGLLETSYEVRLAYEISLLGLQVEKQKILPVIYNDVKLDAGYRIDLLIENQIILEIKAVEQIIPVHKAQLITYLKLSGLRLGFLLNFNVYDMRKGVNRIVS